MAIKISGNTVINDATNVTAGTFDATNISANGVQLTGITPDLQIYQPIITFPEDNAVESTTIPNLQATEFESPFPDKSHANSQFQVSTVSDFSSTVVDEFTGPNNNLVISAGTLAGETEHFFRVRYIDNDGCCSAFSPTVSFTTKTLPSTRGQSICGGFYIGTARHDCSGGGACYYLIVAPNATGCTSCQWKTSLTCSNIGDCIDAAQDGYFNTYCCMVPQGNHPAGNWSATRSINGFDDWYLAGERESFQFYCTYHFGNIPAGESWADGNYWTSTEKNYRNACFVSDIHTYDKSSISCKQQSRSVRPVRRVAFNDAL